MSPVVKTIGQLRAAYSRKVVLYVRPAAALRTQARGRDLLALPSGSRSGFRRQSSSWRFGKRNPSRRLVGTLLHELKRRGAKRGLATLCIGGGMGVAHDG